MAVIKRKQADKLFKMAQHDCGVGSVLANIMWAAVRVGGRGAWNAGHVKSGK